MNEERIAESRSWNDPRGQVMKTPGDVAAMVRLKACGWGIKRIARELGCSHHTVKHYQLGEFLAQHAHDIGGDLLAARTDLIGNALHPQGACQQVGPRQGDLQGLGRERMKEVDLVRGDGSAALQAAEHGRVPDVTCRHVQRAQLLLKFLGRGRRSVRGMSWQFSSRVAMKLA
jgi:hypothetical protein